MCKLNIIKNSLNSIKFLLNRYISIIPKNQKSKYEQDLLMIFNNYENLHDEESLVNMEKLAKTKLKSIQRIYGEIKEEDENENKKFKLMEIENEKYLNDLYKFTEEELNIKIPRKTKYEEIKNSPGFNKEIVNKYQEEYFNSRKELAEKFDKEHAKYKESKIKKEEATEKNNEDKKKAEIENLKEAIREIMKINNFSENEIDLDNFNYDQLISHKENINSNPDLEEMQNMNMADTKKSEELFSSFANNKTKLSEEEVDRFISKIKPILKDSELKEEDKKELIKKELIKAEDQWTVNNLDGKININMYGQLEATFFRDNNEGNDKPESELKSEGVKNYVWRNGELVQGKAKERKTVVYSNWHPGHHNPDDLRKHRELLDRQHYGGPLWEGIKYKTAMQDPASLLHSLPTEEEIELNKEADSKIKLGEGSSEIIDITR